MRKVNKIRVQLEEELHNGENSEEGVSELQKMKLKEDVVSSWLRCRLIEVQDEPLRERWEEGVSSVRVHLPSSIFLNHSSEPNLKGVVE